MLHQLDVWAYQLISGVWRLYWPVLAVVVLFTLVERRFPLAPHQPWRPWFFNVTWHALTLAIYVVLSWSVWGQFVGWLGSVAQAAPARLAAPQGVLDEIVRLALALLAHDFLAYWAHRLQHALPAFWALHQFHHDERHMNAAASLRAHWLNIPFIEVLVLVPIVWLLGFDAMSPAAYFTIHAFVATSHMNVRLEFGRFAKLFVGPQYHRIHHARERRLHDCNFATALPLWDILFGTFHAPAAGEFGPTGVSGIPSSDSWVKVFFQPLVDWWRILRREPTRA